MPRGTVRRCPSSGHYTVMLFSVSVRHCEDDSAAMRTMQIAQECPLQRGASMRYCSTHCPGFRVLARAPRGLGSCQESGIQWAWHSSRGSRCKRPTRPARGDCNFGYKVVETHYIMIRKCNLWQCHIISLCKLLGFLYPIKFITRIWRLPTDILREVRT